MKSIIKNIFIFGFFLASLNVGATQNGDLNFTVLKIQKNNVTVGYLVGVMHFNPIGMIPENLSLISNVIAKSDGVVTELGMHQFIASESNANEAREIVREERKLSTVISEKKMDYIWERLIPILGDGVKGRIQTAHPWDIGNVLISNCSPQMSRIPTEATFLFLAEKYEKPILALESILEQFQALPPYNWEKWEEYLDNILQFTNQTNCFSIYSDLIQRMTTSVYGLKYRNLERVVEESNLIMDAREFNKISVISRNRKMTERIANKIKLNKKYLYVLGAMHLIGADGVVESLKRKGYRVSEVVK